MKTISLPDAIAEEAEILAEQLGISASELHTRALKTYLKKYDRSEISGKLDRLYSEESSDLDPVLAQIQYSSLQREDW